MNEECAEKLLGLLTQMGVRTRLRTLTDFVFMMETNGHLAVSMLKILEKELKNIACDVNLIVTEMGETEDAESEEK